MKLTPTLFPRDSEDEVLIHAEGMQGNLLIFCNAECQNHIHFQYSICGFQGEGRSLFDPKESNKEAAAKELLLLINKMVEQEVLDELRTSTIQ